MCNGHCCLRFYSRTLLPGTLKQECVTHMQTNTQLYTHAGNAWTDAGFDNEGAVDFWWTHALISNEVRDTLLKSCNFSGVGPLQQSSLDGASLEHNGKLEVSPATLS